MEIQRESIFMSTFRTFCRLFFGVWAIFIALVLSSLLYHFIAPASLIQEKTTLEIVPNAQGVQELVSPSAPAILEIPITGVIGDPKNLDSSHIQHILIDSRKGLLRHDRVKGILLYFNTPGGTVIDSDNIYRMLMEYKKRYHVPIYAFVDGLCASGGMYIASAADQIFAGPASIVGSVGVVLGPFFNIYDTLGRIGVQARTLTEGIDKDMLNPTRPWKEGEDASLKALMTFFYQRFVEIVTTGRPRLNKEKLINTYGAQVFDSNTAKEFGYVDHALSSRNDALFALLKEAQIDPEKPYQVVTLSPKSSWLSELIEGKSPLFSGKVEHQIDLGQSPLKDQLAYLYQPLEK